MKKFLSLISAVAMAAMLMLPQTADAAIVASGYCGFGGGTNCTWSIETNSKTLTITGSGFMEDYDYSTSQNTRQPWHQTIEIGGLGTVDLRTYIEHVVVEGEVRRIGAFAFYNLEYLKDITIKTTIPINLIGIHSMSSNPSLEKVIFPSTLDIQNIDENNNFLQDCPKLWWLEGKNVVDGVLYTADKKVLICCPATMSACTVIDGCEEITSQAFDRSDNLESVTLPASIKKFGWSIFYLVSKLKDIYVHMLITPEYNTYIVLPKSPLTEKDITVHVHNDALTLYQNHSKWSEMTIVADLDPAYTGKCGDNITYSFNDKTGELTLTGTGEMYTYGSGYGSSTRAPWYDWHDGEYGPSLVKKITIGEGITSINCFWGSNSYLDAYIEEVTLPSTLQVITGETFYEGRFSNIVLPDNLNYLGASAFAKSNLYSVTFGKSKPYIGTGVFQMSTLQDVYVPWTEESQIPVISASSEIFDDPSVITLHVKKGTKYIYEGMEVWKDFIIVEDFGLKSGKCGENITWTYDGNDGSLVLEGSGSMYNYDLFNDGTNPAPWFEFANVSPYVKSIEVGEGITEIGSMTNNPYLDELSLPSTLTAVRDGTFYRCVYALENSEYPGQLVLPDNLNLISASAFKWWLELKELVIPQSVTSIGDEAFAWCNKLSDVYVFWENESNIPAITTSTFTTKEGDSGVNRASLITLHVPVGFASIYKEKDVWKDMKIVEEYYYTTPYPFYIAGVRATEDNMPMDLSLLGVEGITASGTIEYNEIDRIITLNNVSIEATSDFFMPLIDIIGIDDGDWFEHKYEMITINLVGNNTLTANRQIALYMQGAVTITENATGGGGLIPKMPRRAEAANGLNIVSGSWECLALKTSDFNYSIHKSPARKVKKILDPGHVLTTYKDPYLLIKDVTVNMTANQRTCFSNEGTCEFDNANVKLSGKPAYYGKEIALNDCELLYPANAQYNETYYYYELPNGYASISRLEFGTGDIIGYLVQLTVASADENMGTVNTDVNGLYDNDTKVTVVATAKEHYRFVRWSDGDTNASRELTIGTTDLTLTAEFEAIPQYAVSVMTLANGTVAGAGTYEEGQTATITATANEGYHFDHWTSNLSGDIQTNPYTFTVTQAETFVAVFEQDKAKTYTVTFVGFDSKTLKIETVEEGKSATAPEAPVVEGYTFTGWSPADFSNITSDLTVTVQYTIQTFTVSFVDWDGAKLRADQIVTYGESATAPANPIRQGYNFTGWDKDFSSVTSDLTITALYEILQFTVTFIDKDGKELKTETVDYGKSATAPEAPAVEDFEFIGWDTDFSIVKSDLTVKALYKEVEKPDYTPQNLKVVVVKLEDEDMRITFSWDAVEGAESYELQLLYNGLPLYTTNTYTLHEIPLLLSVLLNETSGIEPGTYQLDWQVRTIDAKGNPVSDWTQGEQFEVVVPVITGIDNSGTQSSSVAADKAHKVLRNGQVLILRNGKEYNTLGAEVK